MIESFACARREAVCGLEVGMALTQRNSNWEIPPLSVSAAFLFSRCVDEDEDIEEEIVGVQKH
jgi:hypothetical protein